MQPTLQKQKSVVPSSCHQFESCVVDMSCHKFWQHIRALKFHELDPAAVTNTEWVEGGQDKHHSLCYDVIYTDHELPAHLDQALYTPRPTWTRPSKRPGPPRPGPLHAWALVRSTHFLKSLQTLCQHLY